MFRNKISTNGFRTGLPVLGFCTLWLTLSLLPQSSKAQFQDCPDFHVCLIGCTNEVLVGGTQQQFNSCTDRCNDNANQCPENRTSNAGFMKKARACSNLHSCLVSCQDPVLSGGTNNDLFACDDRCFANNSGCTGNGRNSSNNNNNYNNNSNNNNSYNNNSNNNNNYNSNNAAKKRKLARKIQQELKDAKCNPGSVDVSTAE